MKKQTWVIIVGIVIVFLIVMGVIALFPREDAGAQQSPSPTTARSTPTQELSDELPVVSADTQTKEPTAPATTASKATTLPTETKEIESQPMATNSDELSVPEISQTTKPTPTPTEATQTTEPTPTASPKPEQTNSNELPFVPAG